MKFLSAFAKVILVCSISTFTAQVIPTKDFNNFFVSFQDGFFRQIEIQPIVSYKAGDEFVAYVDTRGNLRIYDGKERKDVTVLNVEYQVSDHLMGYKIAGGLKMYDGGKFQTLTTFAKEFQVMDSIIVYQDSRYNTLNTYWKGRMYPVQTYFSDFQFPTTIGENILIFRDNSNTYHAFWNGAIIEIGTYNNEVLNFEIGTDVFCFKDPYSQTFYVFDKGEFLQVDNLPIKKYKAGRGFVVYEDMNGNLWRYEKGEKTQLSNFSSSKWEVKDDIVIWMENSYLFAYSKGVKTEICSYSPEKYLLKNNTFAFQDILGGVSVFADGKVTQITNINNCEFFIYGNNVLVNLPNKSSIVYSNGKLYNN
ncbi:MAG: hypothetical protein RL264_2936 [Bacteroidota bacterium]|jgi:hypothetical protein